MHWAGRPSPDAKPGPLEPRNSFKKWTEIVEGTSRSWTLEQGEQTSYLCRWKMCQKYSPMSDNLARMVQLVYGSFIRVWRAKETALRETRLKRLLLHDASHQGAQQ